MTRLATPPRLKTAERHLTPRSTLTRLEQAVNSGAALDKLAEVAAAQGGDPSVIYDPSRFATAPHTFVLTAPRDGFITRCDALAVGVAALRLGAGRERTDDVIDPRVGIRIEAKLGDRVAAGDPLALIRFADEQRRDASVQHLTTAFRIGDTRPDALPLILEEVS